MTTNHQNDKQPLNNDELVRQFLLDNAPADIPDGGFSQRVSKALAEQPQPRQPRIITLNRLWTAACAVVAIVILLNVPVAAQFNSAAQLFMTQGTALVARASASHPEPLTLIIGALAIFYVCLFNLLEDVRNRAATPATQLTHAER